jgi:hypothetical protein
MEHIEAVYLPPWAEPLTVTVVTPHKSNVVTVLDEFLVDPAFTKSTWYTDGSLLAGAAGGAAVCVEAGRMRERVLLPLGDGQVAEGEI